MSRPQIPALLLSTLCYALWLSFARVGSHTIEPPYWALLWVVWALFVWLNPLPILFRPSRYWLLRNLYRQLTSGVRRVEFQDFWMGDQFCSLVFTLADLWFAGCAYSHGLRNWRVCTAGNNWGPMFALGALPLFVRFVQSIRRWVDSRQWTHLVNAGKYGTGVIYYMTYYLWRANGGGYGPRFIPWCIMGMLYATYACAWDFIMDWSFFQPHAKYPLLRSEILYTSWLPVYYIAIITNIIIRFEFVMYIPRSGINYTIRTFIAAMLEMLRRWQWNFFRLENEHLGNMDQYRVTREVPLPYSFDDTNHDSDGGDEDEDVDRRSQSSSWRRRR
ncbi:EXS-domain-containing protein [Rhodofomes roseus]|uniref:EXS-domain-containing protein n=1 Tax=Rhodofomes roseus TaxID=34475 RepID=A0ABQ8K808_9APHY|nr:EXS-domain-containing protein [Rhodofomes roseus]KAH9833274.1 EXS-domain-containing protein [Rhodofomes roseus]